VSQGFPSTFNRYRRARITAAKNVTLDGQYLQRGRIGISYARGEIATILREGFGSPLLGYLRSVIHPPRGPVDAILETLRNDAKPSDVVKISYEDLSLMFHTDLKVVSSTIVGPPAPDWIIERYLSRMRADPDFVKETLKFRYEEMTLPIPDVQPLYRGQNILHSMGVAALGHTIWRQPLARAWHLPPPPREMRHRFSRLGRDSVHVKRLARGEPGPYRGEMAPDRMGGSRLQKLARRARTVLAEDSRYLLYLPLAVPVMAVLAAAFYAGRIAAHFPGRQAAQTEPVVGP
jgi:hypothetical protein